MRSTGGSAVGAGCGVFGLLGLLIGVALTVYLGSKVLDSGGAVGGSSAKVAPEVTATPSPALEGSDVTVTSDGFTPGATVSISVCQLRIGQAPWRCDPSTSVDGTVDPLGQLQVGFSVRRQVTIAGAAVDCSTHGACVLRIRQRIPAARIGSTPLVVTPVASTSPSPTTAPP